MFSAATRLELGGSTLCTGLFVERWFRAHLVVKSRLRYDTALSPPVRAGRASAALYLVGAGTVVTSRGAVHHGRSAWVLTAPEFERPEPSATTFQTSGDPAITMDVHLDPRRIIAPIGIDHGPRRLAPTTWDAFDDLVATIWPLHATSTADAAMGRLFDRLVGDGVLAPDSPPVEFTAAETPSLRRTWTLLADAFARFDARLTLDELSAHSGLSTRQLRRDLRDLAATFDLLGGFRDGLTVMRLRAALLLLSAPHATATEVATRVGYSSLDALGRAFRDAHLPSPIEVRERIRYLAPDTLTR
jgi:AraC-like DNA-binding protein